MPDDPENFETRTPAERLRLSCSERHSAERLELERFRVGLVGADGKNGTIGTLRASVASLRRALITGRITIGTLALGSCGVWLSRIYDAGQSRGAELNRLEQVESSLKELRAAVWVVRSVPPAPPAGDQP